MMMRAAAVAPEDAAPSSNPDTVGRFISMTQTWGYLAAKNPFATFGVGRFQDHHLRVVREQCATAGSDNRRSQRSGTRIEMAAPNSPRQF